MMNIYPKYFISDPQNNVYGKRLLDSLINKPLIQQFRLPKQHIVLYFY